MVNTNNVSNSSLNGMCVFGSLVTLQIVKRLELWILAMATFNGVSVI